MKLLNSLNTFGPFLGLFLCAVFFTSFLVYPDLDPKPFEAVPNPEADVPKVIHDLNISEPSPGHHEVKISDGFRVYDNLRPAMVHSVADSPDLSTAHGILWLISGIGTILSSFIASLVVYKKLKSKYMDTVLNYLRSNSFS